MASKGMAYRSELVKHSGKFSLKLVPFKTNVFDPYGNDFGVGQQLPIEPYRGKPLYFSGWMSTKGGATAVLRLVALGSSGAITFRELRHTSTTQDMAFRQDILDVPDDPTLIALFLFCTVKGPTGAASFDDLMVSNDPSVTTWLMGQPDPGADLTANVYISADQQIRQIPRSIYGSNLEWVLNGQGLWDPVADYFDPTALGLAKDLGATMWRFPGGLYADYYHWQDGIGPRSKRPVVRPAPVPYLSPNNFGTDEALGLATITGGNLVMTVNALTGTPQEAADWVSYINNGSRHVDYWEVGNELYLQLPALDKPYEPGDPSIALTPQEYAQRLIDFSQAMKAADPTIKVGADLEFNYALSAFRLHPDWAQVVIKTAAPYIDYVSVHNGFAPAIGVDGGWDVRTVYSAMLAAPQLIASNLADLSQTIETNAGSDAGHIRVAVTEWGPFFDTNPTDRFIDHVKTMGSAVYTASALKTLIENPRVDVACAFKLMDPLTQGWVGQRDGTWVAKAPYYAMQLFTQHFGQTLLHTDTFAPTYDTRSIGWAEAVENVPYLEAISSTNANQDTLYVIVINKHFDRSFHVNFGMQGFAMGGEGTAYVLNGTAVDANTGTQLPPDGFAQQTVATPDGRFNLGGPGEITVTSTEINPLGTDFQYDFPPHSVTALVIRGGPVPVDYGQAKRSAK